MNHRPAKCCENCRHLNEFGGCKTNYAGCEKWRAWFRREWGSIRRAAARIKENNGREGPKK